MHAFAHSTEPNPTDSRSAYSLLVKLDAIDVVKYLLSGETYRSIARVRYSIARHIREVAS